MAITVKDISEKEFTRTVRGYNVDEVDDFLDEIAKQMELLIRENRALAQQIKDKGSVSAQEAAPQIIQPVVVPAPVIEQPAPVAEAAPIQAAPSTLPPIGDEPTYFRNLETTLRDTLISAQRVAEETVTEARKKAKQMVTSAEEQANAIMANSKAEVEAAREENAQLHQAVEEYRARFLRLVEDQLGILKADNTIFE